MDQIDAAAACRTDALKVTLVFTSVVTTSEDSQSSVRPLLAGFIATRSRVTCPRSGDSYDSVQSLSAESVCTHLRDRRVARQLVSVLLHLNVNVIRRCCVESLVVCSGPLIAGLA